MLKPNLCITHVIMFHCSMLKNDIAIDNKPQIFMLLYVDITFLQCIWYFLCHIKSSDVSNEWWKQFNNRQ